MDNDSGWIKIHRKMIDWEWYNDIPAMRLFLHLLLTSNHKDKKWRGITILAGQKVTGRMSLAEETGLSEHQVRTALDKLKSTGELTSKNTNKYSIITITNWKKHQHTDQQSVQQASSKRPASVQQVATNKNDKNDKNDKKGVVVPDFVSKELWDEFKEHRKQIKCPMTQMAEKMILNRLSEFKEQGYSTDSILKTSIENGWKGVFKPKEPPEHLKEVSPERLAELKKSIEDLRKKGGIL